MSSSQDTAAFLAQAGFLEVHPPREADGLFQIHGELSQIVHIPLQGGQKVQCEPGTMVYTSNDVKSRVSLGGFGRLLTDGSLFKQEYTNNSGSPGFAGFSANYPANIIPVNLDLFGGEIACKHESFLCALDPDCKIRLVSLNSATCLGCCCGGLPFFMEGVNGKGWAFLSAHGTIMEKRLAAGEEIVVDTNSIVAVSKEVSVDVLRTGACSMMCCGGEGIFNTALKGPGVVYMSSMPIEKVRKLFSRPPPKSKKNNNGGGGGGGGGN